MKRLRVPVVLFVALVVAAIMIPANNITPSSSAAQKGGGTITVTGTLQQVEGVECPSMIFLNGYHLVGNLQGFGPGDTVTVTGATDILTTCQQGTPLRVISITAA